MEERQAGSGRRQLLAVIAGAVVAGLAFRAMRTAGLDHTALVFVGIPALLAVAVTLTPRPGSVNGVVMKSTTLALLIAGTLMGEAFVCVLMASPLIYAVALLVAGAVQRQRMKMGRSGAAYAPLLVFVAASVPALEGVAPRLSFPREHTVGISRVVAATPDEVRATLAAPPRFDRPLPRFLRLGFPTPGATSGSGLRVGDRRTVMFAHGHHGGELVMEVTRVEPHRVVFTPVSDGSYLVHWLTWRSAEVRWAAVPGGTSVRWTMKYRRRLDPAWYFAPLEKYGVGLAARYLIETVATPHEEE